MYYRALLYLLPLPLIVFLWNSGKVDLETEAKTLFSLILALLTFGGYMDLYKDEVKSGDDDE